MKITSNASDNGGSDCCIWGGVLCSNDGHVIGLDLSQSYLHGPINSNSTLFNLVHLQILNLSMNDFANSQIPSGIARLNKLRSLDLSSSSFSGQIPIEISHLVHLSSLHMSWNRLKLESPSLENLVQNLTRLEELHLSRINVSSSVPSFLANFSSLRSVYLEDFQLRDEFLVAIFHLPQLKFLSVAKNPSLTGSLHAFHNSTLLEHLDLGSTGFAGIILESITKLKHLVYLSLHKCFFSGPIPRSLSNMTQLSHLDVGLNRLTGFVPSLESLSKLNVLELSDNHFENERLPHWLSKLSKLNELHFDSMYIYDEIPSSLANLTTLRIISITDNYIFGHIPSSFMNLTQLSVIDLGRNQLQGQLLSSFSNFKSVQYLGLDHNNFSGRVDLDTFVGLNKLKALYLSYNKISFFATDNYTDDTLPELKNLGLSSCNLKEFLSFLRFQNKMIGLFLYQNKIEGLVPEWIWNNSLETLHLIGLSNNFITGFHGLPQFLPWKHLQSFEISYIQLRGPLPVPPHGTIVYDVSNNNLSGVIPLLMCKVKSLRVLDLSSNYLTGTLPPCLGNLSNTFVLNLRRNNFHGPIMDTISHGSLLKRIDLSENQLMGRMFKSLANCTNLEFLNLGDNSLEDNFPFWLGNLPKLKVLILRSNKLYGRIQGPMMNRPQFHKLRIIDLSNNSFSGQLPDKLFQTWNEMKSVYVDKSSPMGFDIPFDQLVPFDYPYSMTLTNKDVKREYQKVLNIFTSIDFSCNNFEGHIPQSLQDLGGLESLNLSNNHFIGLVPPSLGNLKNLESLDLSKNELSGTIPQELSQLGFLESFNVSFNHLEGRIPQGKQFSTFDNSSYKGNPRLCGPPLSKDCRSLKTSMLAQTSSRSESLPPSDKIDWIIVFLGVGSGLIIGFIGGNLLYARYSNWF
ncbi:receptor-like protein 7 [Bidens hawaiensis]|uniref:receptor-like protein 7 n=1 Tax=Bidens hawaiensis TaxID=980011 RepID=UPI00404B9C4E